MRISTEDRKVLVGLSGGMGSAVAAALLKSEGYQVVGLHIQITLPEELEQGLSLKCLKNQNQQSVRDICAKLEIPLYVVEKGTEFAAQVIDPLVHHRLQMQKMNPCFLCHSKLWIDTLISEANQRKIKKVATGHYVQMTQSLFSEVKSEASVQLKTASDIESDQSQLLFEVSQEVLSRLMTPLGTLSKTMVRKLAKEFGFQQDTPDLGDQTCNPNGSRFIKWIESRTARSLRQKGVIRNLKGTLLGRHSGLYRYEIGEKIDDPGSLERATSRKTVIGTDFFRNAIILGADSDLLQKTWIATKVSWYKSVEKAKPVPCFARIGQSTEQISCRILFFQTGMIRLEFERSVSLIHTGEPVVFYDGDEVLGGAYLDRAASIGSDLDSEFLMP